MTATVVVAISGMFVLSVVTTAVVFFSGRLGSERGSALYAVRGGPQSRVVTRSIVLLV